MPLQFSHSVGYRGLCSLDGTTVLCTGGNISLTQEPIMGSGVWGAGYRNIAPIAFAWNYLSLEGSADFELTAKADTINGSGTGGSYTGGGDSGDVWKTLRKCCVEDRAEQSPITLYPDGHNGFSGNGWCSSLSFSASEGQAVTGSFGFKGDPATKYNGQNAIIADGDGWASSYLEEAKNGQGLGSLFAGSTLVPYWATSMGYTNEEGNNPYQGNPPAGIYNPSSVTNNVTPLPDIISWSVNYNSDLQMLKCCALNEASPIRADYILAGDTSCDGNFTIFRISGDFSPESYHHIRKNVTFMFDFGKTTNNTYSGGSGSGSNNEAYGVEKNHEIRTIVIPYVVVSSGSTSMTSGASYVSVEYSFTGIGDGENPLIDMSGGNSGSGY